MTANSTNTPALSSGFSPLREAELLRLLQPKRPTHGKDMRALPVRELEMGEAA